MTDPAMSPAQKVLAAIDACDGESDVTVAVAALRAAADEVTPSDLTEPRNYLPMAIECQRIRRDLLAIAADLEAQP